jgi:GR25 family glycosyltransferase involved in LPS biosynthesis
MWAHLIVLAAAVLAIMVGSLYGTSVAPQPKRLAEIDRIFFINLESSQDRRTSMEKQLSRRIVGKDIPYERFEAVHGRVLLDPTNLKGHGLREFVAAHGFRQKVANQGIGFVVGILKSHLGVWQKIVDHHPPGVYMVLEDDANLQLGWQRWLQAALDGLKAQDVEWDMLKLLNVAHHNVSGFENNLSKHPLIRCALRADGKQGCDLRRDRIEDENVARICVNKECERLMRLAPGDDGRNLGMMGYLLRKDSDEGANLQKMIATAKRWIKHKKIIHLDEILNEVIIKEHGVYFLSDNNGGALDVPQGEPRPKVLRVGRIVREATVGQNGKTTETRETHKGVKFERTTGD